MVGNKVYWYMRFQVLKFIGIHPEIGNKKIASNKMRENWTKIAQYLIKYKQKWEREVRKSDERDKMRESDEGE
jgi:hypothetical protein